MLFLRLTTLAMVLYQVHCGDYGYEMSGGGHGGHAIPAAVKSRYSVDVRNVGSVSEPIKGQTVDVGAQQLPITLHFRSVSSALKVLSSHQPGVGDVQKTSSEDEPHKLFHEVTKPVIQEVREVITPYRRIVQEVRPVQEDIQTIVARGHRRGGGGGGGGYGNNGGGNYGKSSSYSY